jgi:hypothetical protein
MAKQIDAPSFSGDEWAGAANGSGKKSHGAKKPLPVPPHYNEALRSRVPDFSDPQRPLTCLEVDFPIGPINKLAQQEGNAGKPIYQMSKWWARRRSSVFRALLLAAATEAPAEGQGNAAKQIWDAYYANHQKGESFRALRTLDPFMGGGTTLVEGARLGMQMHGQDLNPVAWFVVKNEMAGSDPEAVGNLFAEIEAEVKPQIQPFYVTRCPRGHAGQWRDATGAVMTRDPLALAPQDRAGMRWEGPEIIYTFWAKHAPCANHSRLPYRTPVFRSPVVAQKTLSAAYLPLTCPACHLNFDAELGPTRMAPDAERVIPPGVHTFTETTQPFAQLIANYERGTLPERGERIAQVVAAIPQEAGLCCPRCGAFAGERLASVVTDHHTNRRPGKKRDLGVTTKKIAMALLIHPTWLRGAPGGADGVEYGGTIGASPPSSAVWYRRRLRDLALIEVRLVTRDAAPIETDYSLGVELAPAEPEAATDADDDADAPAIAGLPRTITLADGTVCDTTVGTVPAQSVCTCADCGRKNDFLTAVKTSGHSAPTMIYALQGYCPACDTEGYAYNGRFFATPDADDIARLSAAEAEWKRRSEDDIEAFWPHEELPYAYMTHHLNGGIPNWGYTHWWTMFNPRQLLVHAQLLRAITLADPAHWPLDVRMQALGAFQQYLRNQNMFCFWNFNADKMEPHFANSNYHPKSLVIENAVFSSLGRGNWNSCVESVIEGNQWSKESWEGFLPPQSTVALRLASGDVVMSNCASITNGSSTDLPLESESIDLVITDPPFGDNVFYADLADFFYVWLRIPMVRWFAGQPEADYFAPHATPKALEAITNKAEHPDTRTPDERREKVRPPADEFYQATLTQCWAETARVLKPGGLLAFTFHHSEDLPWINVLESLFEAGYVLMATYPIRSDESKGDKGQFGSKKIEYDIIHVCRKRLEEPTEETWPHMRQWVKEEVAALRRMLETYHAEELSEEDIQVILRGKALEFYSRHYGRVIKGSRDPLTTREALQGINTLIDELNEQPRTRPPEGLDPLSYRFLSLFGAQGEMSRDTLHKLLRGSAIDITEFTGPKWLREKPGKRYEVVPIMDRFEDLRKRSRSKLKRVIDQAHFLIGAMVTGTINVGETLERKGNDAIPIDDTLESLLSWYADASDDPIIRDATARAYRSVTHWRASHTAEPNTEQGRLFT